MQNHRVLVTGGAGFIGSNLANHLAERNEVTAVDDGYLGTPEISTTTLSSSSNLSLTMNCPLMWTLCSTSQRSRHTKCTKRIPHRALGSTSRDS